MGLCGVARSKVDSRTEVWSIECLKRDAHGHSSDLSSAQLHHLSLFLFACSHSSTKFKSDGISKGALNTHECLHLITHSIYITAATDTANPYCPRWLSSASPREASLIPGSVFHEQGTKKDGFQGIHLSRFFTACLNCQEDVDCGSVSRIRR